LSLHFFLALFRNCQRVFTSFQLKSLCHLHRQRLFAIPVKGSPREGKSVREY
jgi:hypothetical protein